MATTQSTLSEPEYRNGYNDFHYEKDNGFVEMFLTWHKRLNRMRYFKRVMALGLLGTILAFVIAIATMEPSGRDISTTGYVLMTIMFIALVPSHFMLMIRRLHDLNRTGWLSLLSLVPVVDAIFSLYLLFAPGTVGANNYGADPIECVD